MLQQTGHCQRGALGILPGGPLPVLQSLRRRITIACYAGSTKVLWSGRGDKGAYDEYNAGAANVDLFYANLLSFVQSLSTEEQRGVAEQLGEEELAVFDLLTRPNIELTDGEKAQVKQVAHDLLETLKHGKLVLDWRKKQQARAAVQVTVADILDRLPRAYTSEVYQQKCDQVYQHIYESYFGQGRSMYQRAA